VYYYLASFTILVLDQVTKKYMVSILPLCQSGYCQAIELLPVFKLMVLHNRGAAFSFLDDAGGWQRWFLVFISSGVSLFIAGWLWRVQQSGQQRVLSLALVFILGGALGNLVDRSVQGYVVDFLVFHYDVYYFPAFNIADSAISIGAGLLILDMFMSRQMGEVVSSKET
jgi:signal peptidase II